MRVVLSSASTDHLVASFTITFRTVIISEKQKTAPTKHVDTKPRNTIGLSSGAIPHVISLYSVFSQFNRTCPPVP